MKKMSKIQVKIKSKDAVNTQALFERLLDVEGIDMCTDNSKPIEKGERLLESIDLAAILISGFAIPAFLKVIEIYIEARKVEVEIGIPSKKGAKIIVSSLSKSDLLRQIKKVENWLLEEEKK